MKKVRVILGVVALAPAALALAPPAAHAATRQVECGTPPNHWTEFNEGANYTCWGYNGGTWAGTSLSASGECGGNNYGWYSESTHATGPGTKFHEGTTFTSVHDGFFDALHISGWNGTDTC